MDNIRWEMTTAFVVRPGSAAFHACARCSGLHLYADWLALIVLNQLTIAGILGCAWLTLHDFGCRLGRTGLQSSAPAHARWDYPALCPAEQEAFLLRERPDLCEAHPVQHVPGRRVVRMHERPHL